MDGWTSTLVKLICHLAFPQLQPHRVGLRHACPHLQIRPGVDMDVDVELIMCVCVCVLGMDEYSVVELVCHYASVPRLPRDIVGLRHACPHL